MGKVTGKDRVMEAPVTAHGGPQTSHFRSYWRCQSGEHRETSTNSPNRYSDFFYFHFG